KSFSTSDLKEHYKNSHSGCVTCGPHSSYTCRNTCGVSPLVLDLDGNGIRTGRTTRFDIDGDGRAEEFSDISPRDGVLAFDADGDGRAGESGLELFGNITDLGGDGKPDGLPDGFQSLRAFVRGAVSKGILGADTLKKERLDAQALSALEKAYGLGVLVGGLNGRAVPFKEARVSVLWLPSGPPQTFQNFDGLSNYLTWVRNARFQRPNKTASRYVDVWFVIP
ncbi:MAG: hypothetical protein AAB578_08950, partial [Elusimicrobiota bacterium]